MKAKEYDWFVECLDVFTKNRVCEHFDIGQNPDRLLEKATVTMSDGKKRKANLIQLSLDQKNILLDSLKKHPFQCSLFCRLGKGQIRWVPKKYAKGTPVFSENFEGVSFDRVP
jgi:hypothetical protein